MAAGRASPNGNLSDSEITDPRRQLVGMLARVCVQRARPTARWRSSRERGIAWRVGLRERSIVSIEALQPSTVAGSAKASAKMLKRGGGGRSASKLGAAAPHQTSSA